MSAAMRVLAVALDLQLLDSADPAADELTATTASSSSDRAAVDADSGTVLEDAATSAAVLGFSSPTAAAAALALPLDSLLADSLSALRLAKALNRAFPHGVYIGRGGGGYTGEGGGTVPLPVVALLEPGTTLGSLARRFEHRAGEAGGGVFESGLESSEAIDFDAEAALPQDLLDLAGDVPTFIPTFTEAMKQAARKAVAEPDDVPTELRKAVLVDFINWAAGRFWCCDLALYTTDLEAE